MLLIINLLCYPLLRYSLTKMLQWVYSLEHNYRYEGELRREDRPRYKTVDWFLPPTTEYHDNQLKYLPTIKLLPASLEYFFSCSPCQTLYQLNALST